MTKSVYETLREGCVDGKGHQWGYNNDEDRCIWCGILKEVVAPPREGEINPYYTDNVGRRRKLTPGAQHELMRMWQNGDSTQLIADTFGVSTTLVRTICYHTRRGKK